MSASRRIESAFKLLNLEVFPEEGRISTGAREIHLQPLVMDLLVHLAERSCEVVSREQLIETVWRGAVVTDEVISRSVYQLRQALGDEHRGLIETIPKRGYQLTVNPTPLTPSTSTTSTTSTEPESRSTAQPLLMAWVRGAVTVVLGGILALLLWRLDMLPGFERSVREQNSIAVLPFSYQTEDPTTAVLGEGLSEEVLHTLSGAESLRVVSKNSSFQLTASDLDVIEIGNRLEVETVLEGTIRLDGSSIVVDAWLVDTTTGAELWRSQFTTDADDVFSVQYAIAQAVAGALDVELADVGVQPVIAKSEVYRLYLLGRKTWEGQTPADLERSREFFSEAIALDPDFAPAYAGLAATYAFLFESAARDIDRVTPPADAAIQTALNLNPVLPEAHATYGLIRFHNGEFALAEAALRKSLELRPNYAEAHMWLGRTLQSQGRFEDALIHHTKAAELSPVSAAAQMNMGMTLRTLGDFDGAERAYLKAIDIAPGYLNAYWALGYNYWYSGELEDARNAFEQVANAGFSSADFYGQYGMLLLDIGDLEAAEPWIDQAAILGWNQIWTLHAVAGTYLIQRDISGLTSYSEELVVRDPAGADAGYFAAVAHLLSDQPEAAIRDMAAQERSANTTLLYIWDAELGHLDALLLAGAYGQTGAFEKRDHLLGECREFLADLKRRSFQTPGITYLEGAVEAVAGNHPAALKHLTAAIAQGWRRFWWMDVDPNLASIRETPGYRKLLDANRRLIE